VEIDVNWMGKGKQEAQSRKSEESRIGGQNIQQGTYHRAVFGMYPPLQLREGE
jgi:hypothetical protein